jgi:non-heme chloroperoxidase
MTMAKAKLAAGATTTRRNVLIGGAGLVAAAAVPATMAAADSETKGHATPYRSAGGSTGMDTITTKDGTQIFYKDWGLGQPIVFSHGWPLSADDWDAQMLFFLSKGFRVVAHDRRGHGRSSQIDSGHDMDHYATTSQR